MKKKIVVANNLCIDFPIYSSSNRSIRKVITSTIGGGVKNSHSGRTIVSAIKNASFTFYSGDKVGLIGHNGAGKSTLLRCLAGVYAPTHGSLSVFGSVASLLDLALGLDSEATGVENIYIRGVLFGIKPRDLKMKIDEISEFSELGEFLNIPIRAYSSGMLLRLAFSIFSILQPEIILMDEWLSVGDEGFNKKASERLNDMVGNSALLVLASHDKDLVSSICNRIFRIEHGQLIEITNI
ncbi:ABC transporter ATP-binding protein [Aquitalea aquatilis]|uniref:ABC transporter ATP-binding protein n=1 Tax=Aquitalea aquatilis TaxID=1537400 RepID=UPI0010BD2A42|nr:ABC transporter ATP-binding protein [Aquitalea aquatilis]